MQKIKLLVTSLGLLVFGLTIAQDGENGSQKGHENTNKFRQMYQEFSTPNLFRTGSGAPGSAYYQQQADYKMDITLNDDTKEISGEQTITYTNNAPEALDYLWLQLDQNIAFLHIFYFNVNNILLIGVNPIENTALYSNTLEFISV